MTASTSPTPSLRPAEQLASGDVLRTRRPLRLAHAVGAALVATLLLAYCMVLSASVRRANGLRQAEVSVQQGRMACEKLPRASARSVCNTRAASRGVGDEPIVQP